MDLDGDGRLDLLSGSYSRHDRDMAGLFQVLWGADGGGFRAVEPLRGSDGELLIIAAPKERVTEKICTRPTAVDLDGDGKLDIVAGNFTGTFALFRGDGAGRFAPEHSWLTDQHGEPLRVDAHSDPCCVDWDGDGDLDLVSGSSQGGVFLFPNQGSRTEPKFGARLELVPATGHGTDGVMLGDDWIRGPQGATRVWVDDLNGDGKLDLLIGDSVTICHPAEGLDEATVRARLTEWDAKLQRQSDAFRKLGEDATKEQREEVQRGYDLLWQERAEIVREDMTGFVWVLYQK